MLESPRSAYQSPWKVGINGVSSICTEWLPKSIAQTAVNSAFYMPIFRRQNWLTREFPEPPFIRILHQERKEWFTQERDESLHRNAEATTYSSCPRDQSHMDTRQKSVTWCINRDVLLWCEERSIDSLRFTDFPSVFITISYSHEFDSLFVSYCSFQVINLSASQKGHSCAAYFLL